MTARTSTEQAFIAVATRLFAQKGYHGTSISDLARELKLTTASMYYYVQGKQELLARVLESGMADFLERLEAITQQGVDPRSRLSSAIENHIEWVIDNPDVVRIFFRYRNLLDEEARDHYRKQIDRYEGMFTSILQDARDARVIASDDLTMLRLTTLGLINSTTEWYRPEGTYSPDEVKRRLHELIMSRLMIAP